MDDPVFNNATAGIRPNCKSHVVGLFVYGTAQLILSSITAGSNSTVTKPIQVIGMEVNTNPGHTSIGFSASCRRRLIMTSTLNSRGEMRDLAERLAAKIGAQHVSVSIERAA